MNYVVEEPSASTSSQLIETIDFDPQKIVEKCLYLNSDPYVESIRKKYYTKINKEIHRRKEMIGERKSDVQRRLSRYLYQINLKNNSCSFYLCGRSFSSIDVLAYHVSYAHQNYMSKNPKDTLCLLCGKNWASVKSKIVHMKSRHRELCQKYNDECINQTGHVIPPEAPKARRLAHIEGQRALMETLPSIIYRDEMLVEEHVNNAQYVVYDVGDDDDGSYESQIYSEFAM